jgi:hypothetical protein
MFISFLGQTIYVPKSKTYFVPLNNSLPNSYSTNTRLYLRCSLKTTTLYLGMEGVYSYGDTRSRHDGVGTEQMIATIKRGAMREFYFSMHVPYNQI